MNVLALDPATTTGWAHSSGVSGVWDLSIRRDESRGMRLIRMRKKLKEIHESAGIELVAYEAARNRAPSMQNALVVQAEIQSVIKVFCEDHEIDYIGLSPSEIKKHATGKGNANKEAMVNAASGKFGIDIIDDNHADALHILDFINERYL